MFVVLSIELGTAEERIVEWRVNLENFYIEHLSRRMWDREKGWKKIGLALANWGSDTRENGNHI